MSPDLLFHGCVRALTALCSGGGGRVVNRPGFVARHRGRLATVRQLSFFAMPYFSLGSLQI